MYDLMLYPQNNSIIYVKFNHAEEPLNPRFLIERPELLKQICFEALHPHNRASLDEARTHGSVIQTS